MDSEQDQEQSTPVLTTTDQIDLPLREKPADDNEDQIPILEPSDYDALMYYWGLPNNPELVARSSSQRWDVEEATRLKKEMRFLGKHPLIQAWQNEGPASLRNQIKQLLKRQLVRWQSVRAHRIGFRNDNKELVRTEVILFITVRRGSLFWHKGRHVAIRCKEILEKLGIMDVECEIKQDCAYLGF
ncbi:hypothetical protein CDD81_3183 [Ophiocordyceps australis]|uniref:Uncharacterized protein n=1 Tax=Ophiocordyceps australis TaxID=1399860 RepID=A0A2C5XVN6_9HYPO|nr:hypothetical protein CDD81_3183 [Ophiocordyceps australis]